jgi:hypothetical protein
VAAIDEGTVLSLAASDEGALRGHRLGDGFVWWLEATAFGTLNTRRLT